MNIVLRALSVYIVLLVVLRAAGKRTISEITTFDFILLMILSETIQQSLIGSDLSLSRGILVVLTLVMAEVGLTLMKLKIPVLEKWLDGTPTIIVENGKFSKSRKLEEYPKTGVRAFARTPVFGLPFVIL